MSKSNTYENDLLALYFNATAISAIAANSGSPATNLYVALFTADPTDTASLTSECAYTGYARVAVARSGSGWVVTGNSCSPAANIDFPQCTAGTETATHFGISRTIGGAPDYIGTITPNISISNGVIPRLTTASTVTED